MPQSLFPLLCKLLGYAGSILTVGSGFTACNAWVARLQGVQGHESGRKILNADLQQVLLCRQRQFNLPGMSEPLQPEGISHSQTAKDMHLRRLDWGHCERMRIAAAIKARQNTDSHAHSGEGCEPTTRPEWPPRMLACPRSRSGSTRSGTLLSAPQCWRRLHTSSMHKVT